MKSLLYILIIVFFAILPLSAEEDHIDEAIEIRDSLLETETYEPELPAEQIPETSETVWIREYYPEENTVEPELTAELLPEIFETELVWGFYPEENTGEPEMTTEEYTAGRRRSGIKNRTFEIGFANVRAGFANNFIAARDIFQETAVIDLDNFTRGFDFGFGFDVRPFFINYNFKDRWGFGIDIARIEASGNINIPENLLGLKPANNEKFGAGGAVFADIGIPVFFHIRDFKIKLRPAWFATLVYAEPNMNYTFKTLQKGALLEVNYDMRVFTPFSMEGNTAGTFNSSAIGMDFGAGVEYPLFSRLDLGVNIKNIPFIPSRLKHYTRMTGRAFVNSGEIDFSGLFNGIEIPDEAMGYPENPEPTHGADGINILRPFKSVFYANYRPFENNIITVIPSLGFAVNPLYVKPGSVETGVKARLDLNNLFITTVGIGYEDRLWKNGVDFILNFRYFEFGIGITTQSQNLGKSFQGAGLELNAGLKFGW